jgi:hypothetical protein
MTHTGFPPALKAARLNPWRAILSGLLAIAVLLSSLHHLSCVGEDESFGLASSTSVAIEKTTPPVNGDQCLPGHCHCVCHVSVQAWTDPVSSPVDFRDSAYGLRPDHLPRALAAFPPFEPPRA